MSAKGRSPVDALQSIAGRRETLLRQSKSSGCSYAQRMQPRKLDIQRDYYVTGSRDFQLADDKIQSGAYDGAIALWEEEITNPKPRIRSRAGYNISVLSEFNGDLNGAINWAIKSYDLHENDATLDYITALEQHQAPE